MSELPSGWFPVKLGEVAELKYGKALPAATRDGGEFPVYGSNGIVGHHSTWLTPAPTIVVGRKGSVGEVCFSNKNCSPIDTTYYIDSFDSFEPKFCFYLLKTLRLGNLNKSTAIPGLNRQDAYDLEISLPPISEQTRIAAKLDELLAQVDTLKARIDGIPALLKRFRQSVLTAAVSGRLTEEWRKAGKAIPHLRIGDVCDFRNGFAYKSSDYKKDGIPLVRISDIDGRYAFPSDEIYIDQSLCDERYLISHGDLLIAMSGATTGKIGVYIGDAPALQNQRVGNFLVNSKGQITSEYRNIAISQMAGEIIKSAYGGAQPNISSKEICALRINVPSIDEQTEIVRRVEQLFAFADQLEAKVASAKSRIDHLTQSILAKAFRGELVPQDPNDEPASVLLERIKAQRAAAPKARRGRRAATLS